MTIVPPPGDREALVEDAPGTCTECGAHADDRPKHRAWHRKIRAIELNAECGAAQGAHGHGY